MAEGVRVVEPDDGPVWYGILFNDQSITVKRYFDYGDLREAQSSDFVKYVTRLFEARDRQIAMNIATAKIARKFIK
jgi:hypothetical protein